jgi:hypothetical protein
MEIKIQCACGTKYKFEIEPIGGRMPSSVNCPACGADGTSQANEIIQQALGEPVPASVPSPSAVRVRLASPSPASRPVVSAPLTVNSAAGGKSQSGQSPGKSKLVRVLSTTFTVLVVVFGLWAFGSKWYRRLHTVAGVAQVLGSASVESTEAPDNKNLWYEDCAVLFVRETNHLDVAAACKDYWKERIHKNLTLIDSPQEATTQGEYELMSAHNGYVRILGAIEWPVPQLEGLAQYLSQRFGTTVFEWRSEHFADTYHFGVYEQGTRKFHAKMDVKISGDDADEIVTTEGDDWAIANGYRPGPKGFKEFNVLDADLITKKLGMKLWDEKEGTELKGMLLRETK